MAAEQLTAATETELDAIAARFARTLQPGSVVALTGELGAGKTTFVRAIVRALHGNDAASSPTFTFWHRYDGRPPIHHLDLYRIDDPAEAARIGLEEAFDGEAIVLVEWPQHAPGLAGPHAIRVTIEGSGHRPRLVTLERP